jgi:hypothetical protein
MPFLYAAGVGYGVGMGAWIDGLFKITDPGLALITPTLLGAAGAVGVYLWDANTTLHRGVPASTALGTALGFGFGVGINLAQWQLASSEGGWSFRARSTLTFLTTTGGAVGGWAFGEWLRPDPRSALFIASGAGWGALSGVQIGGGVSSSGRFDGDLKPAGDAVAIGGVMGYVIGTVGTGALAAVWTPSLSTQKWMWAGYGLGTVAGSLVFPLYLVADGEVRRGFIFTGIAGLAGATLAGVLTADLKDDEDGNVTRQGYAKRRRAAWTPTYQLAPMAMPSGAGLGAIGQW